jgi:PTH2 family peptidyl-tRNA hydrolase
MSEYKQAIIIRTDLGMKKGKIASQASHASVSAFVDCQKKNPRACDEWISYQKKIVLKVESERELVMLFESIKKLLPCALIKDAGRTQIEPGSITALGIGPAPDSEIDRYTKHLKLL